MTWFGLSFLCTVLISGLLSYKVAIAPNDTDQAPIENFITVMVTAQVGFGGLILGYYFGTQSNRTGR